MGSIDNLCLLLNRSNLSSTSDVISTLSSDATENILKRLPLRDAVRTSVLSSSWRYKWTTLTQLVFDWDYCPKMLSNMEPMKAVIYQVLLLHCGPLVSFKLSLFGFKTFLDINNWIVILSMKNIQELTFNGFVLDGRKHKLSIRLFSLLQLRALTLLSCVFEPPPTFKGFSCLVSLDLWSVELVPAKFGNFISNCPLLERLSLKLDNCTGFDYLEINAPRLKYFCFCGILKSICFKNTNSLAEIHVWLRNLEGDPEEHVEGNDSNLNCTGFDCLKINAPRLKYFCFRGILKSICFKNTTSLAEIDVWLQNLEGVPEKHVEGNDSNLTKFFNSLPDLENLTLEGAMLKFLFVGNVPENLPCTLNQLKILNLDCDFSFIEEVSRVLYLLRSSPNLQRLEIRITGLSINPTDLEAMVEFLQAQDFSKYNFNTLREVQLQDLSGLEPEKQFIKFLLAYSTALEKMEVEFYSYHMASGEGYRVLTELARFPRASPKAELVFIDSVFIDSNSDL